MAGMMLSLCLADHHSLPSSCWSGTVADTIFRCWWILARHSTSEPLVSPAPSAICPAAQQTLSTPMSPCLEMMGQSNRI